MISDVLFSAVEQIRDQLTEQDRIIDQERERGVSIHRDISLRTDIYSVVDQMERLARRLLTSVEPFVNVRQ